MGQAARKKQEPAATEQELPAMPSNLLGMVFFLAVFAVLAWCSWAVVAWMDDPQRVALSKLVVTGERQFTSDDDIRQSILSLGTPGTFMSQNVDVIQKQVMRLPWIKQVSVRKQWPDELKLHIVEYVPIARWNNVLLLDNDGMVFSVPNDRLENQPLLALFGPENQEKSVLAQYQQTSLELKQNKQNNKPFVITSMSMSERYSWQIVLNDELHLELGRDELSQRLQRFIILYPLIMQKAIDGKQPSSIDLRYETGAAVSWVEIKEQ